MLKTDLKKILHPIILTLFFITGCFLFFSSPPVQEGPSRLDESVSIPSPFKLLEERPFQPSLEEKEFSVNKYDQLIRAASKKHSLDPALVKAVMHAESRFDPQAVSPRGAMGLMQLNPITVKELGIRDPFNPKYNIYGGVRYLRLLIDTFEGNKHLALAAYNAGPSRVHRHKGVPPFKDTKKYVTKVLRYLDYYKNIFGNSGLG